jgi:beta-glucosidase-like glycosyl hydrolase
MVQETLHSGYRGGVVFPMPCGMGSTWDAPLVADIGAAIALEARAGGVDRGFSPELQVWCALCALRGVWT